jgi:hypothetical protein
MIRKTTIKELAGDSENPDSAAPDVDARCTGNLRHKKDPGSGIRGLTTHV